MVSFFEKVLVFTRVIPETKKMEDNHKGASFWKMKMLLKKRRRKAQLIKNTKK